MKSLDSFICENNEQSSLGKKILKLIDNNITQAIIKRTENWDANKFEWSHDPMFLLITPEKTKKDSEETFRDLEWARDKYIDAWKDKVKGTIDNYNVKNDDGDYEYCVLGIFVDRQFFPISSLDNMNKIIDLLQQK